MSEYTEARDRLLLEVVPLLPSLGKDLNTILEYIATAEAVCEAAKKHDVGEFAGSHALLHDALAAWEAKR